MSRDRLEILIPRRAVGWNVGITIKAPRGDGTESVLINAEYTPNLIENPSKLYVDALGLALSVAKQLSSKWCQLS